MKASKLITSAVLYFVGALIGLYMLMQSIRGDDVPTLAIVGTVFLFAAALGWIGGK